MTAPSLPPERFGRAIASLRGLSVGDALGSQFFVPANLPALRAGTLPPGPWQWTDDTEMAASVLAVLAGAGTDTGPGAGRVEGSDIGLDQDELARSFAARHDFDRGYGPAVNRMLRLVRQEGADWRTLAAAQFDGRGSWGNGSAMRVPPLGAWYADDPERAAREAELSATTTHTHPEAVAGAVAVAVAAALVASPTGASPVGQDALLAAVLDLVPPSAVRDGLLRARDLPGDAATATAADVLGCGRRTTAHDTVPFALWSAARHLDDFAGAFWDTARAGGDVDTTCAIVGGVLSSRPGGAPPAAWQALTEPLPAWLPTRPAAGRRSPV